MTQVRNSGRATGPVQGTAPDGAVLADLPDARGMSARSVIASVLMGGRVPQMRAAELVRVTTVFGFAEGTVRVALSRMVAAGELHSLNGHYALAGSLLQRHARQEEARRPALRTWDGTWRVAILGGGPMQRRRSASERVGARKLLKHLRMGEWREGVWIRPDNFTDAPPNLEGCTWMSGARFGDGDKPVDLVLRLWDVEVWSQRAVELAGSMRSTPVSDGLGDSFRLAATVIRHIRDDPLLPDELLPTDWPGAELRKLYEGYRKDFLNELAQVLRQRDESP
jgi:phenylacetic acid degradation operon negative regulatory protein